MAQGQAAFSRWAHTSGTAETLRCLQMEVFPNTSYIIKEAIWPGNGDIAQVVPNSLVLTLSRWRRGEEIGLALRRSCCS